MNAVGMDAGAASGMIGRAAGSAAPRRAHGAPPGEQAAAQSAQQTGMPHLPRRPLPARAAGIERVQNDGLPLPLLALRHLNRTLWLGVTVAPTVCVAVLPMLFVCTQVTLPFLARVGLMACLTFGTWVATQLGALIAVHFEQWLSARADSDVAQRYLDAHPQAPIDSPNSVQNATRPMPVTTMAHLGQGLLASQAPQHSIQRGSQAGDIRAETGQANENMVRRHINMRQYLPVGPHARSVPMPVEAHEKGFLKQVALLQPDGMGYNTIGLQGRPERGSVWVLTLLDGLAVATVDVQWARNLGEWLAGGFLGAWSRFFMVGAELGFTHARQMWGARVNGSINRRTSSGERLLGPKTSDDGQELFVREAARERAGGFAANVALKYRHLQGFARRDVARVAKDETVSDAARHQAEALYQKRVESSPWPWWHGFWPKRAHVQGAQLTTPELLDLRGQQQSRKQSFDHFVGGLRALGNSGYLSGSAAGFLGRHNIHYQGSVLEIARAADGSDAAAIRLSRKGQHSGRWLASVTGGLGHDQGNGAFAQKTQQLQVRCDDAQAQGLLNSLHTALLQQHRHDLNDELGHLGVKRAWRALHTHAQQQLPASERKTPPGWQTELMQGDSDGYEQGGRVDLLGSQWLSAQASPGFCWGSFRQLRRVRFAREVQGDASVADKQLWSGQVQEFGFGPDGKSSRGLWAKVHASASTPQVTVMGDWQMSRADVRDYRQFVLEPLQKAFGITLADGFGGSWRVQRSVQIRRQLGLPELQQLVRAGQHPNASAPLRTLSRVLQPSVAAVPNLQQSKLQAAFDGFWRDAGTDALPLLFAALTDPQFLAEDRQIHPQAPTEVRRTLAQQHERAQWQLESSSDAYRRAEELLESYQLSASMNGDKDAHESLRASALEEVIAAQALVCRDPLLDADGRRRWGIWLARSRRALQPPERNQFLPKFG